jgi:hypothetical protein
VQDRYYALGTRVQMAPGLIRNTGVALRTALDSSFNGVGFASIEPAGKLAKANLP